jgi:hypothetical protein
MSNYFSDFERHLLAGLEYKKMEVRALKQQKYYWEGVARFFAKRWNSEENHCPICNIPLHAARLEDHLSGCCPGKRKD